MKKHLPTAELVSALLLALCVLLVALVHARPGFPRYAEAVSPFFILTPDTETEETIEGYEAETYHAATRNIASVYADTPEARKKNLESNSILKALLSCGD